MAHLQTLRIALLGLSIFLASSGCGRVEFTDENPSCHCTEPDLTMETYTPTPVQLTDVSLPQDAIDQLVVSSVRTALEPMADGIAYLGVPVSAWFTMPNTGVSSGSAFDLLVVSSYPSGGWTIVDDAGAEAPSAGLYEIQFISLMDSSVDTTYLEVEVAMGVDALTAVRVGLIQGFRYGDNAAPAHIVGWIQTPILVPATDRIWFRAMNGTIQTPQAEVNPGDLHKIIIKKLGSLP